MTKPLNFGDRKVQWLGEGERENHVRSNIWKTANVEQKLCKQPQIGV